MPGKDGLEVIEELRPYLPDYFPILMLTGDERAELKETALSSGAKDFLVKPINPVEVRLRIRNLLEARYFHQQLQHNNERLEEMVRQRTRELEGAHVEMLIRLAKAAEYRDDDSGEHTWRVARTCALLAQELGLGPSAPTWCCARLGSTTSARSPSPTASSSSRDASEAEFEVVKGHTRAGAELLSGGRSPLMKLAETLALTHHERWDGGGYPQGLGRGHPRGVAPAGGGRHLRRAHARPHPPQGGVAGEGGGGDPAQAGKQFDPRGGGLPGALRSRRAVHRSPLAARKVRGAGR